jgi:nuclear pore complex protein Nup62
VIEEINGVSSMLSNSSGTDDPVCSKQSTLSTLTNSSQLSHVVRVLNSHLSQLQKIDNDASTLQARVQEAQKHARAMGGSDWRVGTDSSEEFYKSFSRH